MPLPKSPHDLFCGSHPESERFDDEDQMIDPQIETVVEDPQEDEPVTSGEIIEAPPPQTAVVATDGDQSSTVLNMIIQAATNPDVDVEKMERLMAMHDGIAAKKAEAEFNEALSLAQSETPVVGVDSRNTQTSSKYASYAALDRALRPIYTRHGFSLSFDTGDDAPDDHIRVLCHVGHRSGHTRVYKADMPADGKGAKGGSVMTKTHAAGSAFSYAQRYLLKLIFNVATGENDDDGNAAGAQERISTEQKDYLVKQIRESGADTEKFLQYFKIQSVDEMPVAAFSRAKRLLQEKVNA